MQRESGVHIPEGCIGSDSRAVSGAGLGGVGGGHHRDEARKPGTEPEGQASFNFIAAVTICSDFGAPQK